MLSCGVLWGRVGTSEDKLVVQGRAEAPESTLKLVDFRLRDHAGVRGADVPETRLT